MKPRCLLLRSVAALLFIGLAALILCGHMSCDEQGGLSKFGAFLTVPWFRMIVTVISSMTTGHHASSDSTTLVREDLFCVGSDEISNATTLVVLGCGVDYASLSPGRGLTGRLRLLLEVANGPSTAKSPTACLTTVLAGGRGIDPAYRWLDLVAKTGMELLSAPRLPVSEAEIMAMWLQREQRHLRTQSSALPRADTPINCSCLEYPHQQGLVARLRPDLANQRFDLYLESNSTSTRTNAVNTLLLLQTIAYRDGMQAIDASATVDAMNGHCLESQQTKKVDVVVFTNDFHRWRSLRVFRQACEDVFGAAEACRIRVATNTATNADGLATSFEIRENVVGSTSCKMWLRELAASVLYAVFGWA